MAERPDSFLYSNEMLYDFLFRFGGHECKFILKR